jgi:hypothetical protein
MPTREDLRDIARQLQTLVDASPLSEEAVDPWTAVAHATCDRIHRDHPDVRLPIQVMHYVHDADIRARDPEYRDRQRRVISEIISEFEHGAVPKSRGITISFTPHQAVAFGATGALFFAVLVRSCR